MKTSAHYEERYKKPFTCEICHNTFKNVRIVKAPQFLNDFLHCWQAKGSFPV